MADLQAIRELVARNQMDYSHYTLARFVSQVIPQASTLDLLLLVLVNSEIGQGNGCVEIDSIQQKIMKLGWQELPASKELLRHIGSSVVIGTVDEEKPLVFDLNRLYLNRYYYYEHCIAQTLLTLAAGDEMLEPQAIDAINRIFPSGDEIDMQKMAAIVGSRHRLSIISGGPGTGKTWTVSKLLVLLAMQQPNVKIKLAAPTGKAASRLSESITALQDQLPQQDPTSRAIELQAQTLHRLLGIHRFTHQPRFNRAHPLDCDVLVVDEASMIDLQLMAQLCEALPEKGKLILLGDKDQLSSVEAGSVFADLCGGLAHTQFNSRQRQWCKTNWNHDVSAHRQQFALADQVVVLNKSHRFEDSSEIGQLANRVKQGDSDSSMELLQRSQHSSSLAWLQPGEQQIARQLQQQALPMAISLVQADSIEQAFARFRQYQILCAVWKGPAGVDYINEQLERALKNRLNVSPETEMYAGKPLMMTSNANEYDIHNGDIGILWADENDDLKIWFELGNNEFRVLSLAQCPQHQSAYAMTVHKSQGSEFEKVLLILPATEVAVLTRELFYTAITRASQRVEIWAQEDIISSTIQRKTQRASGLMQRLQQS